MPYARNKAHCHEEVDAKHKSVRQKKSFTPKQQKIIDEEVDRLLAANFIREVTYPD